MDSGGPEAPELSLGRHAPRGLRRGNLRLMLRDRDFHAFAAGSRVRKRRLVRKWRLRGPRGTRSAACGIGIWCMAGCRSFERQCGLHRCKRPLVPAFSIGVQALRRFVPPRRLEGQAAFGADNRAFRTGRGPGASKGRVTDTAKFSGLPVEGAALLAGFYHRSVLRCGYLAERESGVVPILAAGRWPEKKWFEVSRIGYPVRGCSAAQVSRTF